MPKAMWAVAAFGATCHCRTCEPSTAKTGKGNVQFESLSKPRTFSFPVQAAERLAGAAAVSAGGRRHIFLTGKHFVKGTFIQWHLYLICPINQWAQFPGRTV